MKREGKSRTQPRLKSSKVGASLVEVIISFGLLTTIMFAVGAMLINQQKEVQSLSESLARLEVEKLLIGVLADGKVCTKLLASKTFSSTTLNWQPSLALTGLPANELSGASNILSVNSLASSLSSSLKIDTIDFVDILNNNATPASNSWRASLVVSFTGSIRALKPIKIQTILMTDSDPVTKTVINCSSVANLPTPTWVFSSGIQWDSSPNGGTFISGAAPHPPGIQPSGDANGDFYFAFAPDCPPGQKVLNCAFRQTTLLGAELGISTSYSLSNSPIWPYPHSVSARLLYDDLDTESRPRCKLLLRNIYPARYYPAILCQ